MHILQHPNPPHQCAHYRSGSRCKSTKTSSSKVGAASINTSMFCSSHKYANPAIHILIKAALKGKSEWSWDFNAIYEVIEAIQERPSQLSIIITNLFTNTQLLEAVFIYNIPQLKSGKPKWANVKTLVKFFITLYEFHKAGEKAMNALKWYQIRWRRMKKARFQVVISKAVNDEDPFTLEKIKTIDHKRLFVYTDSHNRIYAFDLPYLYNACYTLGAWNPFTREAFSKADLARIVKSYEKLPYHIKNIYDDDHVDTVSSVVVDLLSLFDAEGFYTDMRWFEGLTATHVWQYWHCFNTSDRPSRNLTTAFAPSNLTVAILNQGNEFAVKYLVASMKCAFLGSNQYRFNIACNILVTLGEVRPSVGDALPEWVYLAC